ncbi:integration host factor subunit beta [candidate division KSB1 bacterium]|nr:integration host factor subunit beta [candidate division KSB1 bacterium]
MTKADIVDVVSEGTGLTKVETQAVIDGFLATVSYALQQGDRVDLRGFGNFRVTQRKARTVINPVTKKAIMVAAQKSALFKPSKELKKFINT